MKWKDMMAIIEMYRKDIKKWLENHSDVKDIIVQEPYGFGPEVQVIFLKEIKEEDLERYKPTIKMFVGSDKCVREFKHFDIDLLDSMYEEIKAR